MSLWFAITSESKVKHTPSCGLIISLCLGTIRADIGGGSESAEDKEKLEELERQRLEALREAEERRNEKHRKMEEEREKMRQGFRDKVNVSDLLLLWLWVHLILKLAGKAQIIQLLDTFLCFSIAFKSTESRRRKRKRKRCASNRKRWWAVRPPTMDSIVKRRHPKKLRPKLRQQIRTNSQVRSFFFFFIFDAWRLIRINQFHRFVLFRIENHHRKFSQRNQNFNRGQVRDSVGKGWPTSISRLIEMQKSHKSRHHIDLPFCKLLNIFRIDRIRISVDSMSPASCRLRCLIHSPIIVFCF